MNKSEQLTPEEERVHRWGSIIVSERVFQEKVREVERQIIEGIRRLAEEGNEIASAKVYCPPRGMGEKPSPSGEDL